MVALGDDDKIVPFAEFVGGENLSGRRSPGEFLHGGLLLLGAGFFGVIDHDRGADADFFAGSHQDTAASLLVEHAGIFAGRIDVGLVATDHKGRGIHELAAVLDAGVGLILLVLGGEAEGQPQLKIRGLRAVIDEEGVGLDGFLGGRLAGERAVAHGPDVFVAVPAGKGLAVED